jgi:hypothetical protein
MIEIILLLIVLATMMSGDSCDETERRRDQQLSKQLAKALLYRLPISHRGASKIHAAHNEPLCLHRLAALI